jgi:hypothetical protein
MGAASSWSEATGTGVRGDALEKHNQETRHSIHSCCCRRGVHHYGKRHSSQPLAEGGTSRCRVIGMFGSAVGDKQKQGGHSERPTQITHSGT